MRCRYFVKRYLCRSRCQRKVGRVLREETGSGGAGGKVAPLKPPTLSPPLVVLVPTEPDATRRLRVLRPAPPVFRGCARDPFLSRRTRSAVAEMGERRNRKAVGVTLPLSRWSNRPSPAPCFVLLGPPPISSPQLSRSHSRPTPPSSTPGPPPRLVPTPPALPNGRLRASPPRDPTRDRRSSTARTNPEPRPLLLTRASGPGRHSA